MQSRLLGLIAHPWRLIRILKYVLIVRRVEAYPLGVLLVSRCFCNSQKSTKNNRFFFEKFRHSFSAVNFWLVSQIFVSSRYGRCATWYLRQFISLLIALAFFMMTKTCRKTYFLRIFFRKFFNVQIIRFFFWFDKPSAYMCWICCSVWYLVWFYPPKLFIKYTKLSKNGEIY